MYSRQVIQISSAWTQVEHFVDRVRQALKSDGWDTDPFTLVKHSDGRLIGRGASDDKGPVLGWLNAIEAYQKSKQELPVNLKFCFEGMPRTREPSDLLLTLIGMEETGSEGLDDLIKAEAGKGKYFDGVDCVCIVSDLLFTWGSHLLPVSLPTV